MVVIAIWLCWRTGLGSAYSPFEWTKAGWVPPIAARVTYIIGVFALLGAPFYPPVGLWSYIVLMYGFTRYSPELEFVYVSRLPEIVLGMSLVGWWLWNQRHEWGRPVPRGVAPAALAGLVFWEVLSASVATVSTNYWPPHPNHEPTQLIEAGIAFLIAAKFLTDRRSVLAIAILLATTLIVRESIWRNLTYLNNDLSALLAIVIPLVFGASSVARRWMLKFVLFGVALYLTWLLYTTQNRAAGLGFVAAMIVIWLNSRRRLIALGVVLMLIVGAIPLLRETDYWSRFATEIYRDGKFVGSAESRLELWDATWKVIQQRPLFGTGPGSVSRIIGEDPRIGHYVAHSNYLELLAETGVPGLILYLVFFGATIYSALRLQRVAPADWRERLAKYLVASLAAYLICGMFISRQDLALAYILAGIIFAIASLDALREEVVKAQAR